MEAIFVSDWIGFFILGIGILFLFGEILVNMRGIFAVVGISAIVIYFYNYTVDPTMFTLMLIIFFISLILIVVDGKLINDGTLAVLGLLGIIVSVSLAAPNLYAGLYAVIGVLVGAGSSFAFLKVLPSRNMWAKITLKDRLTDEAGYSSINQGYGSLVGQKGVTLTDFRPVGTLVINGKQYSGVSNGQWIKKDTEIEVKQVDGTRILIAPLIIEE